MLTLYFSPGMSSLATRIALYETGAPFEAKRLSFADKEQRSPEYLKLNLEGKVPTLVVDGRPITEVAATLYYLAKRYPDAKLLPTDLIGEAEAISWMSFIASTVHGARRRGWPHAIAMNRIAEERLGARPWALGDNYSVADIHLFRVYWRFAPLMAAEGGKFPGLEAHAQRIMQRPAVKKALDDEMALGIDPPPAR